jgi:hypothetical protein
MHRNTSQAIRIALDETQRSFVADDHASTSSA